jgi:hypothetical protein
VNGFVFANFSALFSKKDENEKLPYMRHFAMPKSLAKQIEIEKLWRDQAMETFK